LCRFVSKCIKVSIVSIRKRWSLEFLSNFFWTVFLEDKGFLFLHPCWKASREKAENPDLDLNFPDPITRSKNHSLYWEDYKRKHLREEIMKRDRLLVLDSIVQTYQTSPKNNDAKKASPWFNDQCPLQTRSYCRYFWLHT
jgi:hypothetical protein